jgi:uncharacterized membrane protein (UPF0127 family)
MGKHKHKKYNKVKREVVPPNKMYVLIKTLFIIVACIGLFYFSMYMSKCYVTKVCTSRTLEKIVRSEYTVLMPKGALVVEVANTQASREQGLSGRVSMADDEGLLFIFDTPGRYGFWMKDMNFPLDIIWINGDGIVVSIERGVTKESYPKAFINQSDATYVLEVNAGLAEKFGLYMGTKVKITD